MRIITALRQADLQMKGTQVPFLDRGKIHNCCHPPSPEDML
ncbi:hypothetical protein LEMLEM_LOCUS20021 [Lemmus lemmus]